ncbi:hypothetical protein, partial [Methylotetracoccus oryzae]|uniref:hypothetical protein n=1 Tax=Methylotetracoccus oryzae TaxID=1919059 RepID=UPI001F2DD2CB
GLLLLLVIGQRGEGRLFHPVTAFTCSVGDSLPAAFVQRLLNPFNFSVREANSVSTIGNLPSKPARKSMMA